MSFDAFERAIVAEPLREVARHWLEMKGERRIPGWSNIRPSKIFRQLPIIWSWRYDRRSDRFTGRLAGDQIEAAFGKSFRGAEMTELFPPEQFQHIFARHRRVVTEPCFFHGHGVVFRHIARYGRGERIILPLAENALDADGILGATVYQSAPGAIAGDQAAETEIEEWFGLG